MCLQTETAQPFEIIGLKDKFDRVNYWLNGVTLTIAGDQVIQGEFSPLGENYTGHEFLDYGLSDLSFLPFMYPVIYLSLAKLSPIPERFIKPVGLTLGFGGVTFLYEYQQLKSSGNVEAFLKDEAYYILGAVTFGANKYFYKNVYLNHKENFLESIEIINIERKKLGLIEGLRRGIEYSVSNQKPSFKNILSRKMLNVLS